VETLTAADMTRRCAFKIDDPSRGPGRVEFTASDEGFGLEGPRNLRSRETLPPNKETLYVVRRCTRSQAALATKQLENVNR
jgi:hypothetical protein